MGQISTVGFLLVEAGTNVDEISYSSDWRVLARSLSSLGMAVPTCSAEWKIGTDPTMIEHRSGVAGVIVYPVFHRHSDGGPKSTGRSEECKFIIGWANCEKIKVIKFKRKIEPGFERGTSSSTAVCSTALLGRLLEKSQLYGD